MMGREPQQRSSRGTCQPHIQRPTSNLEHRTKETVRRLGFPAGDLSCRQFDVGSWTFDVGRSAWTLNTDRTVRANPALRSNMIRVALPFHLRMLAKIDGEVTLDVASPV